MIIQKQTTQESETDKIVNSWFNANDSMNVNLNQLKELRDLLNNLQPVPQKKLSWNDVEVGDYVITNNGEFKKTDINVMDMYGSKWFIDVIGGRGFYGHILKEKHKLIKIIKKENMERREI